jgi:hypothetical protein
MADSGSGVTTTDGQLDWSGGVDSLSIPTIQSQHLPNGLARNELAWLVNGSVRGGGILPRTGWQPIGTIHGANGLYQGGLMYDPGVTSFPYLLVNISGQTYKVDPNAFNPTVISSIATAMPPTQPFFNYCQAEQFVVIQAGDGQTLPLFYDGNTLRRSIGITSTVVAPGTPGVNELPPATSMTYYMGRIWYAQGRTFSAGDIVFGQSGTAQYNFRDSILNVTENPLSVGGDGFAIPTQEGNIRALFYNANLNTQLGQGQLFIGSRRAIYTLQVPVTRTAWIGASNTNQPLLTVAQLYYGPVNDRCLVKANADVFYQSLEPAIRSLYMSLRDFNQWGNIPISSNMTRVLSFMDRSLMAGSSGILFDNRVWETQLPVQLPQGIVYQAVAAMDLTPIGVFQHNVAPAWEGIYQGLNILQLFTGDFGGRERAFAIVVSAVDGSIQLWEMTDSSRTDNGDNRITTVMEFPAMTFGNEYLLKKLVSAELWIDSISGEVTYQIDYRPDGDPCWKPWTQFKVCSARNSAEDCMNPVAYPLTPFREGYRSMLSMPEPKAGCESSTGRPANIAYQFQTRITQHGWGRVRGWMLHSLPIEKKLYQNLVC